MQVISSTIEILLINNHRVNTKPINCFLRDVRDKSYKIIKNQDFNESLELIEQHKIDIIFYVFNPNENSHLSELSEIQQFNILDLPLILIYTTEDFDFTDISVEVDDYLIWSDLTTSLLEKTIFLALKRYKHRQKCTLTSNDNIELSFRLLTSKNLFKTIVSNTSTLIWACDQTGNNTFLNQAWSRVLGQKIETKLNSSWMLNIHPQDIVACRQIFNQALAETKGFKISYRLKDFTEEYRWISNHAVPQFTMNGKFKGLVGYCFDITDHKNIEQELIKRSASDRLLAQITKKIHASLNLDQILQTTIIELNQFLQAEKIQINRVDRQSKLTLLFESRLHDPNSSCNIDQPQRFPVILFQNNLTQLSAGKIVVEKCLDSSTITDKACSISLVPIICEHELWGVLCIEQCFIAKEWTKEETILLARVAMELSVAINQAKLYQQLAQANQELEQLSIVDGLTGIANRRKFDQYITAEWTRLAREQSPLSLILCDIDHFKLYNDTYGHQAGDLCLQKVAQAISKVVNRPADLVARYGGEEFVLVLPNTPLAGAKHLAQQVRLQIEALRIPHINSPLDLHVTLSLGVSCCIPHRNYSFQTLVAAADKGLYQAKAQGRNRVVECETKPEKFTMST